MHLTEPIPTLPEPLITLQPLLDVMLAKKPEDRYQSGDELAQAIREYEIAIAKGELPSLMLPSDEERNKILNALPTARSASKPTPEPRSTTPPPSAAKRGRAEPTIGRIEDYAGEGMRPRAHHETEPVGSGGLLKWGIAALVLIGIGAGLWFNQEALRKLLPSSQVGSSLARADAAFQAGKLTGSPDSAETQYPRHPERGPGQLPGHGGPQARGREARVRRARRRSARATWPRRARSRRRPKGLLQGGPRSRSSRPR
jgi:hypothetical protein